MITPRFSLEQDDKFLYVTIHAPFTNLEDTEIFMDGQDFRFSSRPYYLRLHLPGEVVESEDAAGEYLADTTSFRIKCPKASPGERFDNLEMITKLLTPPGEVQVKSGIEEVSEDEAGVIDPEEDLESWYFEQTYPDESELLLDKISKDGYGFAFSQVGVFARLHGEFNELLDIKDPDTKSWSQRREELKAFEDEKFCSDHYLCDKYEVDYLENVLRFRAWWQLEEKDEDPDKTFNFDKEEQERLLALPRKQPLIEARHKVATYATLMEILFAYCYDQRTNEGEPSCESGWCIAKLSPTISGCVRPTSLKQSVISTFRRSLIFPLYRNWDLSQQVFADVVQLLDHGRVAIIKALLKVLELFSEREGYHVLSQLYIQDFAVWVQSIPPSHLQSLSISLKKIVEGIDKTDLGLDLPELEAAAEATIEEEKVANLCNDLKNNLQLSQQSSKIGNNSSELDSDDDSDSDSSKSEDSDSASEDSDNSSEESDSSSEESNDSNDTDSEDVKKNES